MEQLLQQIEQYKQEIASVVPDGAEALEAYRIRFLGTKGIVKSLFAEMKNVPGDQKKEFGLLASPETRFPWVRIIPLRWYATRSSISSAGWVFPLRKARRSKTTGIILPR